MNSKDVRGDEPEPSSMSRPSAATVTDALPSLQDLPPPLPTPTLPQFAAAAATLLKRTRQITSAPRKIEPINRAPVSERSRQFLRRYYPGVSVHDWNDWKWQVRNRIRRSEELEKVTPDERDAVVRRTGNLPIAITPYYLSLLSPDDPLQPLRRTHVPVGDEFIRGVGEDPDPLGEDHDTAVPGLVHRYPDRACCS
jgi:hypothetical protein